MEVARHDRRPASGRVVGLPEPGSGDCAALPELAGAGGRDRVITSPPYSAGWKSSPQQQVGRPTSIHFWVTRITYPQSGHSSLSRRVLCLRSLALGSSSACGYGSPISLTSSSSWRRSSSVGTVAVILPV